MRPRDYSAAELRENVIITLPRELVSEGIPRIDPATGREGSFNAVRMPEGTVVGGRDVSGFEAHPAFVNPSRAGEGFREVPLLRDREVWLQRQLFGPDGNFAIDASGHRARETVVADPDELAAAIRRARAGPGPARDARSLAERAASARTASGALARAAPAPARMPERG